MTTRKDKIAANEAALKAAAAAMNPSKDDVEQAERLLEEIGKNAVGLDSVEKLAQVEKLLGLAGVSAKETQDAIKEVAKKRTRKVAAQATPAAQEVTDVVAKEAPTLSEEVGSNVDTVAIKNPSPDPKGMWAKATEAARASKERHDARKASQEALEEAAQDVQVTVAKDFAEAAPTPTPKPSLLSRVGSALTGKTAQHLAMAFTGGLVGGALGIIGSAELAKRQAAASAQKSLRYVEL